MIYVLYIYIYIYIYVCIYIYIYIYTYACLIRARESSHDFRGTPRTFNLVKQQMDKNQTSHEPLNNHCFRLSFNLFVCMLLYL